MEKETHMPAGGSCQGDAGRFLHEILVMGELMQSCGAEVFRVEDTLNRMGRAFGVERMNVFVITSSIVITMELPDGRELTQTRRIREAGGNDFTKLERLNVLSREYCASPFDAEELGRRLQDIRRESIPRRKRFAGSVLAASSFAVFFGGSLWDGLTAGAFAVLICLMQEYVAKLCLNTMVFNVVTAFLSGMGICAVSHLIPELHMDMIIIGDIMLLIPGIAITNAVRDVLTGDTISGIMRFIEAMLWAGCLAFGFVSAIWLSGRIW
ncbi:MAG: threonine/serine exporter family protein [Eubacteriales bacterium]|nr:threonine/serine exporter family protein [Eubacteriales bacterium]